MRAYLREHWRVIAAFFAFAAVFGVTFALYGLPLEAVAYPAGLCALLGGALALEDILCSRRKHRELVRLREAGAALLDQLPSMRTAEGADCAAIIAALRRELARRETENQAQRRELTAYYTAWVHQIKTPIAAMGLVLQEENTQQDRELRFQLFQIERYVEMVLAYLRMGSDSTDYLIRTCDLGDIVRQALRKYAPIFIRKKITLELDPIFVRVLTDEKWLCFCIEQILSNAVKYADVGGCVHIAAQEETLIVEDNGIGIAPQDLPRIWEKGFTGHNGRIDKRASGIGLYLTKQILGKLGHTIEIASQPGLGTKVSINLHADALMLE